MRRCSCIVVVSCVSCKKYHTGNKNINAVSPALLLCEVKHVEQCARIHVLAGSSGKH